MHHEEKTRKIPRIDLHRHAVGQLDQRLRRDVRDVQYRVDVSGRSEDLDRMWTVNLCYGVDCLIEIPCAHDVSFAFSAQEDQPVDRACSATWKAPSRVIYSAPIG